VSAGRKVGRWLASPVTSIIGSVTMLLVVAAFLIWLVLFSVEKITGSQTLPELLAPARLTPGQKIAEDEIECGVYIVLADMKAANSKSSKVEDKVIKTNLNHKRVHKTSLCNLLYDMGALVAPGSVREKAPRRQDWYLFGEFALEGKRKLAIRERLRELFTQGYGQKDMPDWKATNYERPNRKRTLGNQTEAERKGLRDALDAVPHPKIKLPDGKEVEDPEGGFQFYQPKR
jgi:hypothetical protein